MNEKPNSVNRCKFILASGRECRELEGWHTRHTHAFVESSPFGPVAEPAEPNVREEILAALPTKPIALLKKLSTLGFKAEEAKLKLLSMLAANPPEVIMQNDQTLVSAEPTAEGPCSYCLGSKTVAVSSESLMACPVCCKCKYGCTREAYCVSCTIHRPYPAAPQPVAGEGPLICPECRLPIKLNDSKYAHAECVWPLEIKAKFTEMIKQKRAEGTPKLEEIAREILTLMSRSDVFDMYSEVTAILRPFITPACSPKIKWDTPDKVAWLIINRIIDQSGWPTATPEAREKAHDIVQQEIETFVATPASTGELAPHHPTCNYWTKPIGSPGCICIAVNRNELSTGEANGWISVEERLPEIRKRCLVEVSGQIYAAYLAENGWFYELWRGAGDYDQGMWRGPKPAGHSLTGKFKDYPPVTRWRELPPPPKANA